MFSTDANGLSASAVVLFLLTPWWQDKMHYTDVDTAVRFLPIGIPAGFAAPMVSKLLQKTPSKFIATGGLVFCIVGTVLFPFADQRDRYWSLLFPAMVLGTIGAQTLYVTARCVFLPSRYNAHSPDFITAVSPSSKPRRLK
jgi:predicted MFS family arabinose efflux permease